MYSNNIMPNYGPNIRGNGFGLRNRNNGDRFLGGGFVVPFVLGGITGGLLARPGGFGAYPPPPPYPMPYPVPYVPNNPYPTYSENYYYY